MPRKIAEKLGAERTVTFRLDVLLAEIVSIFWYNFFWWRFAKCSAETYWYGRLQIYYFAICLQKLLSTFWEMLRIIWNFFYAFSTLTNKTLKKSVKLFYIFKLQQLFNNTTEFFWNYSETCSQAPFNNQLAIRQISIITCNLLLWNT